MDRLELARRLFGDGVEGTSTFHPAETQTYIGTAVSDSADGLVRVDIGNSTTEDGEEGIEVATTVSVKEGEEVYVTAVGGTVAKSYYVSGVVGLGDETNSRITAIETDYVKATMLEADLAEIGVLTADSAVISELQAETAKVENVTAAQLEASTAYIGALQTGNVTAQNIIADKAKLAQIDTAQISADHAVINTLDSNYAKIDLANVSNAWINDGVIRDAAIGDAQIADISANKLTAGTINGSVINVTNLNATNITTGTINGQRLGEGSISLSKLSESVYTEGEVDSIVSNLNDRIDSAIETYTATAVPTLSNYPASSWDTNDERAEHVGDICYVLNAGSETDGYTYRFAYDNSTGTYQWVLIKDNQVTAALQRLVDAEGDIDGLQSFQSDTSVWISDTDEALNVIRTNHTSLTTVVNKTIVETVQLWYSKANTTAPAKPTSQVTSTSTSGGAWRTVVPSYSTSYPNYFYCYQWKYADGTYGWSSVTRDIAMGEAQSTSRTAASNASTAITNASAAQTTADGAATAASNAQATANSNIKSSVQLWYSKDNETAPSKPTAQVTSTSTSGNGWRTVVPTYSSSYPYYYYCYQYQMGDGTYKWSDVVYDRATTESQSTARATASSLSNYITTNDGALAALKSQVDGQLEVWYGNADPTASNLPASGWDSDQKTAHSGDLYYNVSDGTVWQWSGSSWTELPDDAAAAALNAAQDAQATADGKRRIFTTTPTVPYDIGDLWVTGNEVRYATVKKSSSQSYSASDWSQTATDDTAANNAQATADKNVKTSVQLWYTKGNETPPAKPSARVTSDSTSGGGWRIVVPSYNASYPKYFYCYQYELADGTYTWSDVVFDRATTENEANAHSALTQLTTKVDTQTFNDLTDTVSEHTNTITTLTTTTQQMTEKIDNINVGGRNLLPISAWYKAEDGSYEANGLTITYEGDGWFGVSGATTGTGGINLWGDGSTLTPAFDTLDGFDNTQLVLMVEAEGKPFVSGDTYSTSTHIVMYGVSYDYSYRLGGYSPLVLFRTTTESTTRISEIRYYIGPNIPTGTTVSGRFRISIKRGNVATDWTPAPEDMATGAQLTTVSNTVNIVSQKADSNIQKISNLTTTLGTNADGTTNVNDIVHRESVLEQDLNTFKSTVSETYATKNELSAETTARTTAIQQTTEAIALKANSSDVYTKTATDGLISTEVTNRNAAIQTATDGIRSEVSETYATKTEVRRTDTGSGTVVTSDDAANLPLLALTIHGKSVQDGTPTPSAPVEIQSVEGRNLSPFFSNPLNDATYWYTTTNLVAYGTQLEDGWVHLDNLSVNMNISPKWSALQLKPNTTYYLMFELRNGTYTSNAIYGRTYKDNASPWNAGTSVAINNDGVYLLACTTLADVSSSSITHVRTFFTCNSSATFTGDLRVSIYEALSGYQPYQSIKAAITGKNLLDPTDRMGATSLTAKGITCVMNEDGWIDVSGTVTGTSASIIALWGANTTDAIFPAGDYALSVETDGFDFSTDFRLQAYRDSSALYINSATHVMTFSSTAGVKRISFYIYSSATGKTIDGRFRVQLEHGSEATDYEPYTDASAFIPLNGHALRSLSDGTADELRVEDGTETFVKAIGYASASMLAAAAATPTALTNYVRIPCSYAMGDDQVTPSDNRRRGLCNVMQFTGGGFSSDTLHCYTNGRTVYLFAPIGDKQTWTAATAAEWITEHNVEVIAALATPQTISLGTIDLPSLPSPSFSLHVDAAVSPTFDAEWWTQGGEEVGSVYQRTSELEQDAEGLSVRMRGLETDAVRKSKDEWTAWLDVGTDSNNNPFLAMGQSGNDLNSRLSNESMGFYNGTEELMKLSGAEGVKADTVRSKRVYIGSWILEELDSGDMAIKLVGGGA